MEHNIDKQAVAVVQPDWFLNTKLLSLLCVAPWPPYPPLGTQDIPIF